MELREKQRWILFGLPFTFTEYIIKEDVLTIDSGFFKKVQNDCYMYKIQDVKLERSFLQRWFGLGNVICYTGDTTHQQLILKNIKHSQAVKDFILDYSEAARMKRRTIHSLDIGTASEEADLLDE